MGVKYPDERALVWNALNKNKFYFEKTTQYKKQMRDSLMSRAFVLQAALFSLKNYALNLLFTSAQLIRLKKAAI